MDRRALHEASYQQESVDENVSVVVIAPTYNNADTLCEVLGRVEALGLPLIVVNDGSTDKTAEVLASWTGAARRVPVSVITHPHNRGKAAALHTGFDAASSKGHTHAITIDTDGQHDPADIPPMLGAVRRTPDALVLGCRQRDLAGCPGSHRLGWWMSALGIWLETGRRVLDSQCGLRVYPLSLLKIVRCRAGRYGFEAEIVTRAAWAGCPIAEVPVTCAYSPASARVSHFRPWRDGIRQFLMHAALTIRRLIPWPHPTITPNRSDPQARHRTDDPERRSSMDLWVNWISPAALWRQLRRDRFEQLLVAAGLGVGTFMAAMPLGGWQILLGVYSSRRLRVHLIPVILGSLLCIAPVGHTLSKIAIGIGHLLCHLRLPDWTVFDPAAVDHWTLLGRLPLAWPVGALITGFFANWITIPLFVRVFRLIPVVRDENTG